MMSGMIVDKSYQAVTGRKGDIIQQGMAVDYSRYESGSIAFDYERELEHWYWDPDSTTESEYSFAMIQYNSGLYTYENSTSAYRNDCLEAGEILGVLPDEGFPPGGECFASGLDESYVGNRFYITPDGYDLYLEREGGGYLSFSFRSHLFPDRAVE